MECAKERRLSDAPTFFSTTHISKYEISQVVYRQDDFADSVFYIRTGQVKITVTSKEGKEAVVGILGAGDFFGEKVLNGQVLRKATAVALTECAITRIQKADFIRLVHSDPKFYELFISHLLARNTRIEEDLADQLLNSSEKRLARTLLLLASFGTGSETEPIPAKVSQETLAEMIGTTRARVSFFMNRFRRLGLIDYDSQIEVHRPLLKRFLDEKSKIRS